MADSHVDARGVRGPGVHTRWPGLIEAYRDRLPVDADTRVVTLLEGDREQGASA